MVVRVEAQTDFTLHRCFLAFLFRVQTNDLVSLTWLQVNALGSVIAQEVQILTICTIRETRVSPRLACGRAARNLILGVVQDVTLADFVVLESFSTALSRVRSREQVQLLIQVVFVVEAHLWLFFANKLWEIRFIARVVTFKSFMTFFAKVAVLWINQQVRENEENADLCIELDAADWKGDAIV